MIDFTARRYPHTGFGDDFDTAIKFMLIRNPQSDPEHSWDAGTPRITTFTIRHSNDVIFQNDGRDPYEMTVRLWFPDVAALEAMTSAQGATATLRYAWGITDTVGGSLETIAGRAYLALPETQLVSLTERMLAHGKPPAATATFRRSVGAASIAGFAQAIETGE